MTLEQKIDLAEYDLQLMRELLAECEEEKRNAISDESKKHWTERVENAKRQVRIAEERVNNLKA